MNQNYLDTQAGWPVEPVRVPREIARRIMVLMPLPTNLADPKQLVSGVPDATAVAIMDTVVGSSAWRTRRSPSGDVATKARNWLRERTREETNRLECRSLNRWRLLEFLFANVQAERLSLPEALELASDGRNEKSCAQILRRVGVAKLAEHMSRSGYFDEWRCEWLAWSALSPWLGSRATAAPLPTASPTIDFAQQMPLHAQVLEYHYHRWLERKTWGVGEIFTSEPRGELAHFARPNSFMSAWLATLQIATGIQPSLDETLMDLLGRLPAGSRSAMEQQLLVGLCDDQLEMLLIASADALQHTPKWAAGAYGGWPDALTMERTGVLSFETELRAGWWKPDSALRPDVLRWLRSRLLSVAKARPIRWFFERPVDDDGFRELNPGWPAPAYLQGHREGIEAVADNEEYVVVAGRESREAVLFRSPVQCESISVELWNKRHARVDAKALFYVYSENLRGTSSSERLSDVLAAAYSFQQQELLFFVDAIGQHTDIEDRLGERFAILNAWERHRDSTPGSGSAVLRAGLSALLRVYKSVRTILVKNEPLQFSPLAGGEPRALIAQHAQACADVAAHTTKIVRSVAPDMHLRFVIPTLNGDIQDVLRDHSVSADQATILATFCDTRSWLMG